jgi:hypothetical protein
VYIIQVGSCKSALENALAGVSCKLHHVNTAARVKKSLRGKFYKLNFEASCNLYYVICMKYLCAHSHEWTCVSHIASCKHGITVSKMVYALIKLGADLGSCNLCTTHQCLPFTPATPLTFPHLVEVGQVTATINSKNIVTSLLLLRHNSAGRSLLLYI